MKQAIPFLLFATACQAPSPQQEPAPAETRIPASITISWLPASVARHNPVFLEAADVHTLDANLLAIVTLVESGGWTKARSPSGARGLMQLMPSTARDITTTRGLPHDASALDDPAHNVDLGAWYLAQQLAAFRSIELAAAAYNAGPGALRLHLEGQGPLSPQTERYQRWITGMWNERDAARSPTLNAWIEAGGGRLLAKAHAEIPAP